MQSINPETIFELTPEGHDVLQHRSLQLPTELRFLLMLINGSRTVGTLRVVTPAAKHDDAGFIILQEYGLIDALNKEIATESGLSDQTYDESVASESISGIEPEIAFLETAGTFNEAASESTPPIETPELAISYTTISSSSSTIFDKQEPHFRETVEVIKFESLQNGTAEYTLPFEEATSSTMDTSQIDVSEEDRAAVEQILRRALKQDSKFVIDQLAQKRTYADFLPAIKRLESALRATVSMIEADALRNRFAEAF